MRKKKANKLYRLSKFSYMWEINYPISKIGILPYFNGVGKNDEGYFVIPQGSGILINANTSEEVLEKEFAVYGENVSVNEENLSNNSHCNLPIFGEYKSNGQGFLAIITEAAEQALITVDRNELFSGLSARTLYAIGEGILIAKVKQNSNTTYRVSDYGRLGADGKPRE